MKEPNDIDEIAVTIEISKVTFLAKMQKLNLINLKWELFLNQVR
jgi:hypothetical protein